MSTTVELERNSPRQTGWLIGIASGRHFIEHLACVSAACYTQHLGAVEASTVLLVRGLPLQQKQWCGRPMASQPSKPLMWW